jgi:hypothetical protein
MNTVKTGSVPGATPLVVAVGDMQFPITVTLQSAAGGRLIEASSTGDQSAGSWYAITPANTTASMINATIASSVSHIRVTGQAGDVYRAQ